MSRTTLAMALHTVLMSRAWKRSVSSGDAAARVGHALGRCPRVVARFRRAQQILKRSSAHVVGQLHEWEHIAAGFVLVVVFMITCLVRLRASLLVIHHCAIAFFKGEAAQSAPHVAHARSCETRGREIRASGLKDTRNARRVDAPKSLPPGASGGAHAAIPSHRCPSAAMRRIAPRLCAVAAQKHIAQRQWVRGEARTNAAAVVLPPQLLWPWVEDAEIEGLCATASGLGTSPSMCGIASGIVII